ncbi:hypothetical protein J2X04_001345 [Lysobacter niabensis]|uniref:Transposase n=1 Tax=Agrilutibacter niabensis TaxID=380628 RepID=A0ABU1VPH3_9GAMM|nr:hypothetical protein [Lysobacter niabensis]MDR7098998.1 hypothetical protein [Lysobacter niabensis]
MVVIAVVHFISPLIQPIATRPHASLAKAHDFLRHVFQFMPDVRFTHSGASSRLQAGTAAGLPPIQESNPRKQNDNRAVMRACLPCDEDEKGLSNRNARVS